MEQFALIGQKIDIPGLIALLVATPLLVLSVQNFLLSKASKNWSKVIGTITSIPERHSGQKFLLEYEYVIRNHNYKNSRISYPNTVVYSNRSTLEFERKYTKHQIVDVFYNPKKPEQAVLEPGRTHRSFLAIVILGVIALYGLLAVFIPNLYAQLTDILSQLFN